MYALTTLSALPAAGTVQSRSISPENRTGGKGQGGQAVSGCMEKEAATLGHGWKISPCIDIKPGETVTLADIAGSGRIRHIWMTGYHVMWRMGILRMYWDDAETPSVQCPLGDFFACAEVEKIEPFSSLAVCMNPKNALNCYWDMPFRKHCRITVENCSPVTMRLFYQIDYLETPVDENAGYFHAQFRRTVCVPYKEVYTVAEDIHGQGKYVGTYMYWSVHGSDWWGEGEMKFFIDGDGEYPTICGTGTEDYFCGGDGFLTRDNAQYQTYCTPYTGFLKTLPDACLNSRQSFSMYRWHIADPVFFDRELRVTVQDLGWRSPDRSLGYQARRDDISSVAFWYQTVPAATAAALPPVHELEIL